ncbi:MAG: zinc-binding alcohol dehydrogenase family protein [Verrucomicrobiales bacterium]|nr:zinc-binding alcohol dehydrogenase family protein [Verrucomicrobiales bacterium]
MSPFTSHLKQTAIQLEKPERFTEVTQQLSEPLPGEARVRIRRIGVCGTDIHAFHGRQPFFSYPRILGHELAAEIVSLNGESDFAPGDLVAIEPYLNTPDSPASKKGKPNCCEELQVLGVHTDGGMRPQINVPIRKLHRSSGCSPDQLALVEMLGIGRHAVNRSLAQPSDRALVLGAGPIGLSVLSFLKLTTSETAVADLDDARLAFCREGLGINRTLQFNSTTNKEAAIRDAFGGELPDLIFDATGNAQSMHSSFDLIAHGGRIVFAGLFQGDVTFHDPLFHRKEITLLSSRNATPSEFREVITSIEEGSIDTAPWISHRLPLHEVPSRFPGLVSDPSLRKAVIYLD